MRRLVYFVMLLYCSTRSVAHAFCYPNYCHNVTDFVPVPEPGFQCLLTRVKVGEACKKYISEDNIQSSSENTRSKFTLRAYVAGTEPSFLTTAFNLSITDIDFQKLVTYYQQMDDKNELYCREIRLYDSETYSAPKELYVSCPFAKASYENKDYQLNYIVTGNTYKYRKQYIFRVPIHMSLGGNIAEYTPFVYVDVSESPNISLHIQPLPDLYNITWYKVWLIKDDSNWYKTFDVRTGDELLYDLSGHSGHFYFKVAPMHPICGDYGCANSTTPMIEWPQRHLLLMIISTVWVVPVIIFILYGLHNLCRKVLSKIRGKPRCLLVYMPSTPSHTSVILKLQRYLRNCDIDVMVLELNAMDIAGRDPKHMDTASRNAQNADVILIAVSPLPEKAIASSIYQSANSYLLRLTNASQSRTKRYYVVQLPYCKSDDLPKEVNSNMTVVCLPKELHKLIKLIHRPAEYISSASDKEFLDSVKTAKLEFFGGDPDIPKDERETENLLTSETTEVSNNCNNDSEFMPMNKNFTLDILDLDLLGENKNSDQIFTRNASTNNNCAIRLDHLIT